VEMSEIHPSAVVHKDAELADGVAIGPNCVIGSGALIGSGTVLDANVVIEKNVKIGRNNRFFSNSVIGAWPQVLGLTESEVGGLVIGDGNVLHEQVTIHSSMHPDKATKIGNENFLMVGVHLGHDCRLEDKIVMSNCAQVSGHCRIETGVWLSGMVGLHQFVTLGKWCFVAGLAGLNKDIPPFLTVSGHYPPMVRGVNKRGMQRAGLNEEQQERILEAYRRLYRQGGTLLENADALAQEDGLDENVKAIVDAITRSSKHQYGRYLETLRKF
ncbi:MAG: acyl-ACP--UDP-N-acetylglucosamine O-acyltransferase, partial [Planctomycetes bacterium]|nr:acyl-ACP--UDP-N-acetylglucosamine O-acyltransferase [Planctomycetota bacterium]